MSGLMFRYMQKITRSLKSIIEQAMKTSTKEIERKHGGDTSKD